MSLFAGKTYEIFNNGPVYRARRNGEENVIDFSSFKQFQAKFSSLNFSIKYVTKGVERYSINGKNYPVTEGQYLLTNAFTNGEVIIDSDEYVNGICVELSPELIAEVLAIQFAPANPYPEKDFFTFLTTAVFFEHTYNADKTKLGKYLQSAMPGLSVESFTSKLQKAEFFYGLAEKMLDDQYDVYKYFRSFDAVKNSTKKDLLYRLMTGKEWIDNHYTEDLGIQAIASAATMSEYYFLRLFKKIFRCTPHQYLVNLRLQKALELLKCQNESIINIAHACGFTDIYGFSKSFRKRFGKSPTEHRMYLNNTRYNTIFFEQNGNT